MFDAVTLAAVTDELNAKILHGRVQEIVQLDALTFGFEIYAQRSRRYLFVIARPDDARVHLVSQKLRASGDPPTPILLLLRKHVQDAFIDSIVQLPNERVLKIQIDHSSEGVSTLVVETIGRYSNLILLDAGGIVMDSAKRVASNINRTRTVLPRQVYVPPPPQKKDNLLVLTADRLTTILSAKREAKLGQTLVKSVAGVSPLFAREVEHRVGEQADAEKILAVMKQLSHAPWQPTVANEDGEPAAFAPYALTGYAEVSYFDSISSAIEAFYGAEETYAALKDLLLSQLADARDKLANKRDSLARSLPSEQEIERLRTSGEMILGYAAEIHVGQKQLKAENGNGIIDVELDPKLSAVENAQKYFKEYHRAKDAGARVPALLAAANSDLEYAEQMLNDLDLAESRAEIDAVMQQAREAGLLGRESEGKRSRAHQPVANEPRLFQSADGFTILVGKNARQNEEITFRLAKPEDLWLHARGVAGAHVVIVRAGRDVPQRTIEQAAQYAAQHSQGRGESKLDVIVTERKNVRHVRGGKPGMVIVTKESVVRVRV